jgi:hypothetical protein
MLHGYDNTHFDDPTDAAIIQFNIEYTDDCKFKYYRFTFEMYDNSNVAVVTPFGRAV